MSQMNCQNSQNLDYLEHYGIKGMKWGIIRSRKELGYDDEPKKKKSFTDGSGLMSKRQVRKIQRERLKTEARKRKEKQAAREKEKKEKEAAAKKAAEEVELREKLKTSSDPEFIYKHRSLLSTQELNDRINRINTEKTIKNLMESKDSNMKNLENFLKRSASMAQSVSTITESMRKMSGKSGGEKNDTPEKIRKEQLKQAKIKTARDKLAYEKEDREAKKVAEKEAKEAREAAAKAEKEARDSFRDFMSSTDRYDFSKNYSAESESSSKSQSKTSSGFSAADAFRRAKNVYDQERSTTLATVNAWASSSSSQHAQDFIDDIVAEYDEHGRRIR